MRETSITLSTPKNALSRRFILWSLVVAFLWMALMPAVAGARLAWDPLAFEKICSTSISAARSSSESPQNEPDSKKPANAVQATKHCNWCQLHQFDSSLPLIASHAHWLVPDAASSDLSSSTSVVFVQPLQWPHARPRAPPLSV